jgi:hypothetical protein
MHSVAKAAAACGLGCGERLVIVLRWHFKYSGSDIDATATFLLTHWLTSVAQRLLASNQNE